MHATVFGILKLARRLEGAGLVTAQAEDTVASIADAFRKGLATRQDLTINGTAT